MSRSCDAEVEHALSRLEHWHSVALNFKGVSVKPSLKIMRVKQQRFATCEKRLNATVNAAAAIRKMVGEASCKLERRGPTGGFCVSKHRLRKGGNDCISPMLAANLVKHAFGNHSSVVDLGCGVGQYGEWFAKHAPSLRWTGFDGAEGIEEATDGKVRFADLTDGLPVDARRRRFDWSLSLEVAEHISRAGEAAFVHALASAAHTGLVLSWAKPGQGGGGGGAKHVNCQKEQYVDCAMNLLGWRRDWRLQHLLLHHPDSTLPCHWLRYNILPFKVDRAGGIKAALKGKDKVLRASDPIDVARLRQLLQRPFSEAKFGQLYQNLTLRLCPFSAYGSCDPPKRNATALALMRNRTRALLEEKGLCSGSGCDALMLNRTKLAEAFRASSSQGRGHLWNQVKHGVRVR